MREPVLAHIKASAENEPDGIEPDHPGLERRPIELGVVCSGRHPLKRFASGSETGNVILYQLDADYLLLGEDDNLDDPLLTQALEDGTYEKLEEEAAEEKARAQGT